MLSPGHPIFGTKLKNCRPHNVRSPGDKEESSVTHHRMARQALDSQRASGDTTGKPSRGRGNGYGQILNCTVTLKDDQAYFLKDKYKYEQSRCTLDKTLEKMNCILVTKNFSTEKSNFVGKMTFQMITLSLPVFFLTWPSVTTYW